MDASDPRCPVVRELMAYWHEHPHAADTLEGICQWWLGATSASIGLVDDALAWLVRCAVVEAYTAADGRVHYRLSDESMTGPC